MIFHILFTQRNNGVIGGSYHEQCRKQSNPRYSHDWTTDRIVSID